jgi:hypothetical protein
MFNLFLPLLIALALFALVRTGVLRALVGALTGALRAAQDAFTGCILIDTLTVTASGTGYSRSFDVAGKRKIVWLAQASALAAAASVVVTAQISVDGGDTWMDQDAFAAITANGLTRKDPTSETGPKVRFKWVESAAGTVTVKMFMAYIDPSVYNAAR